MLKPFDKNCDLRQLYIGNKPYGVSPLNEHADRTCET
jgi:hypothetical protein